MGGKIMKKNLTEIYWLRIKKEMSKEIIKISEDEDRKKSSVIRLLLAEALHNRKKDNKLLN